MDDDRTRAGGWLAVRLQEKSYPSLAPVTKLRQSPNMATVSRATGPSRRVSLRNAQTWSARPAADTSAAAHTSATAWIDFRVGGDMYLFPLVRLRAHLHRHRRCLCRCRGRALFLWPLSLSCPLLDTLVAWSRFAALLLSRGEPVAITFVAVEGVLSFSGRSGSAALPSSETVRLLPSRGWRAVLLD